MTLFGAKKGRNPHKDFPETYYNHVFFSERLFKGIEFVAHCEKLSKKQAADKLMTYGMSSWMGEKVTEYLQDERNTMDYHQRLSTRRWLSGQGN